MKQPNKKNNKSDTYLIITEILFIIMFIITIIIVLWVGWQTEEDNHIQDNQDVQSYYDVFTPSIEVSDILETNTTNF